MSNSFIRHPSKHKIICLRNDVKCPSTAQSENLTYSSKRHMQVFCKKVKEKRILRDTFRILNVIPTLLSFTLTALNKKLKLDQHIKIITELI